MSRADHPTNLTGIERARIQRAARCKCEQPHGPHYPWAARCPCYGCTHVIVVGEFSEDAWGTS